MQGSVIYPLLHTHFIHSHNGLTFKPTSVLSMFFIFFIYLLTTTAETENFEILPFLCSALLGLSFQ